MKALVLILAFGFSSASLAAATCPQDMKMVTLCKSTPEPNDHEIAANILDSIAICSKGNQAYMVAESNGDMMEATPAKVDSRAGGISYTINLEGVMMSISFATGTPPAPTKKARFSMQVTSETISSTYTCTK